MKRVSGDDIVATLKAIGKSVPATVIASAMGTDIRTVATALRIPRREGRVKITYRRGKKGEQVRGFYRFLRSKPLCRNLSDFE